MNQKYPKAGKVKINDKFWSEYTANIRRITLPYVFKKMEETDYLTNFYSVINEDGERHIGNSFADGLLFEALRGACDFLADKPDVVLEAYVDKIIDIASNAQAEDGFLCTHTMQKCLYG